MLLRTTSNLKYLLEDIYLFIKVRKTGVPWNIEVVAINATAKVELERILK